MIFSIIVTILVSIWTKKPSQEIIYNAFDKPLTESTFVENSIKNEEKETCVNANAIENIDKNTTNENNND